MDENPYEAPAEVAESRQRHDGRRPMLDPFWQRAAWIVLMLPFLFWIVATVLFALSR